VVVTFFFGLIHGFGFAGVLGELNLPTAQFAWALLQFNLGLELGQLMIVVSVTAVLFLLRPWPRYRVWVIRGGSMAAMLVGVLWLIERTANVSLLPI
jgi:HupE / UreJ protein